MTSILDKLNLRPGERRLVVFVAIVVFLVLNFVLVWPRFGDLGRTQQKLKDARDTLRKFQMELARKPQYERELKRLESAGQFIPSEAQALELQREVQVQVAQTGVTVTRWDATQRTASLKTNSFFDEQTLTIQVNTGEKELVEFLYNLAKGQSLIRVRSLNLRRDPSQTRLDGSIMLVKSFQRKPPPRAATPVTVAAATTTKAAAPASKPEAKPQTQAPPAIREAKPAPSTNAVAAATNFPRRSLSVPTVGKK
jgi:Tfp pilus assembly protein PilO